MRIIVVGFKLKEEHSVFYQSAPSKDDVTDIIEVSGTMIAKAVMKDADFVSVRIVRGVNLCQ